jgi:glutathione synthase/RimK-type ligase-like ATP-grasp enzyme
MPRVALATCRELPDGDEDAGVLVAALERAGMNARWRSWDDGGPWDEDLVVVRSTWDYTLRPAEFLTWARSVPRLANPAAVLAWNSDKRYLRDVAGAGIPVIPTEWAAPGEEFVAPPGVAEFVVKPSVGAGSRGAGRFTSDATAAAIEHARHLHDAGRTVLVQPYLTQVDALGERALVYLDGAFSHAVSKSAMLPAGVAFRVEDRAADSLFVEERITPAEAGPQDLDVADAVVEFLRARFGAELLYARVDLLPGPDGPVVLEVEVTEPSLFLGHSATAADRFAAAIARRA